MKIRTFILISLLALAPAGALGETLPQISTDVEGVVALARSLDAFGEARGRADVPGAYRTRLGLQIHPSCLRLGGTHEDYDRWAAGAADLVANRCWNRYPELRYLLGQWISQARRAIVTCEDKTQEQAKHGGMNLLSRSSLRELKPEAIAGIVVTENFLPGALETLIALPMDRITGEIARPTPNLTAYSAIETLVHELFHSTSADALLSPEHFKRESTAYRNETACARSAADDPVSYLTSLCTGMSLTSSRSNAEDAALGRISCKKGCAATLKLVSKHLRKADRAAGEELARAAPGLCVRAASASHCARISAERALAREALSKEAVEARSTLVAALQVVLPDLAYQLKAGYLRAEPALASLIARLESLPCSRGTLYRHAALPGDVMVEGSPQDYGPPAKRVGWIDGSLRSVVSLARTCRLAGAELEEAERTVASALERRSQMFGSGILIHALEEMRAAENFVASLRASLARDPRLLDARLGLAERYLGKALFDRLRAFASRLGDADPAPICP